MNALQRVKKEYQPGYWQRADRSGRGNRSCILAVAVGIVAASIFFIPRYVVAGEFGPVIEEIRPLSAHPGTTVEISGSGFGPPREGDYKVLFNDAAGTIFEPVVNFYSDPQGVIEGFFVLVPPQATTGPITVTLPSIEFGGKPVDVSSDSDFTVLPLDDDEGDEPIPLFSTAGAFTPALAANPILFRRLAAPNFASEVADSKDVAIADLDNDFDLDAFIPQTTCGTCPNDDTVYFNDGNDAANDPNMTVVPGQVTNDVSAKRQYGAASADLDQDGDIDVMPSGHAPQGEPTRVRLLLNDGTGLFTDFAMANITDLVTITGSAFGWDDVKFADMDGDGDLDVAIANRCASGTCAGADERSALLIQNLPGFFTAIKDAFGEPASEVHHDVLPCDFNADGRPDVVLSQDMRGAMAPLRLLLNLGGAPPSFSDASARLIPNPAAHSEHLGCQDFNNDGLMDLHVGIWARSDVGPADPGRRADMIYLNASVDADSSGDIDLSELQLDLVANPEPGLIWGQGFDANSYSGAYGDFDSDGLVDILVGSVTPDPAMKGPFLMRNEGGGVFTNVSPSNAFWRDLSNMGFDHFNVTSPAVGDLNGDGHPDIIWGMGDGMNGSYTEANRIYIQEAPPTAQVCAVIVTECSGPLTAVQLDGTCSSDPEGAMLSHAWSSPTCIFDDTTAAMPNAECPLGSNEVSLIVTDPTGLVSGPDLAMVSIADTLPPELTISASPSSLWPPNHKLRGVDNEVVVVDSCDPAVDITLVSVASDEPDNGTADGNTANDIQDAEVGQDDRSILLRAERSGRGAGRTYTITYRAEDDSGNEALADTTVNVPHDRRKM